MKKQIAARFPAGMALPRSIADFFGSAEGMRVNNRRSDGSWQVRKVRNPHPDRFLRSCAGQARPKGAVETGQMSFEFRQAHVRGHVNSGERESGQRRTEASSDIHECT